MKALMKMALLGAVTLCFPGSVSAATISVPGDGWIGGFTRNEVYGQSFVVGRESVLDSMALAARSRSGSDEEVLFEIFRFDDAANKVVGTSLYRATGTVVASASLQPVKISTGGWSLDTGLSYILSLRHADGSGSGNWGFNYSADTYGDGAFHYSNTSRYLNGVWNTNFGGASRDMQIELTFSQVPTVPVPASLPLLLAAFGGLSFAVRRRQFRGLHGDRPAVLPDRLHDHRRSQPRCHRRESERTFAPRHPGCHGTDPARSAACSGVDAAGRVWQLGRHGPPPQGRGLIDAGSDGPGWSSKRAVPAGPPLMADVETAPLLAPHCGQHRVRHRT